MNLKDVLKEVKNLVFSKDEDEKSFQYKGRKAKYSRGKFEAVEELPEADEILVIEEVKEGEPVLVIDEAGEESKADAGFYLIEAEEETMVIEVSDAGVIEYVEVIDEVSPVEENISDAVSGVETEMEDEAPLDGEVSVSQLKEIVDELIRKVNDLETKLNVSDEVITEYSQVMLKMSKKLKDIEKQPATDKVIVETQYSKNVKKSKTDIFAEIQKDVISKIKK
jgi:hypothetical protein